MRLLKLKDSYRKLYKLMPPGYILTYVRTHKILNSSEFK